MMPVDPAILAALDQINADATDRAKAFAATHLAAEDITLDDDEQLMVEAGIAAGIAGLLAALRARGLQVTKVE
jgi:predicted transcriptional regulator